MADDVRAPTCHDALFHDVFSRRDAFALVLRRLLPKEVLPHVDFASLRPAPTKQTDQRLRTRWPDLRYVAFLQHPARNTPVRLSEIQPMPPRLRALLGAPVELTMLVDDFSGSVMGDTEIDLPTRAFVEIARAFMHAYKNPGALTEARLRELAPLFDILLVHKRPGDIRTLWMYVISAYEEGSPLRDLIANAVSKEVKEEFMTIKDAWIAEGRTEGVAKSLLRLLENRAITISEAIRARVLDTRDEGLLLRWFDRAVSMTTAEEVFAPLEARP